MATRLTPEGYAKLKSELDELVNVNRPDVAKKLKEASEGKDFEDNPELEAVRMEQSFVEGRILELSTLLATAEVIKDTHSFDTAELGAIVTIKDDDAVSRYRLVNPAEANPMEGKISVQSPFGKAISGKKPGDIVTVHAPDGVFSIEIISIE
ncbi:MAG: transcription elongation factor GreA [Anaerolineaceae bacterium]|jgi:transcription elongation factor GreA|nr:MAG: transcription elongation factor GreA [Chloroflexi bacterium HGW-Chloroflexi-8]